MNDLQALKMQLLDAVENHQDELIEFCSKLIQIPSVNPPGDTTEITAFIENYLHEVGITYQKYEAADKMFNLVALLVMVKEKNLFIVVIQMLYLWAIYRSGISIHSQER